MRRHTLVLLVVLAAVLGACSEVAPEVSLNEQVPAAQALAEEVVEGEGGAEAAEASAEEADVVWVAENIEFTEAPDTMPAEAVIALEIQGGLPHNVVFEGVQSDQPLVEGGGEGVFVSSTGVPPGTYTYYCSVVGHRASGMEGEITVE
jgi:plastocyanin